MDPLKTYYSDSKPTSTCSYICVISGETANTNFIVFRTWAQNPQSTWAQNPQSTTLEASMPTITPPMWLYFIMMMVTLMTVFVTKLYPYLILIFFYDIQEA